MADIFISYAKNNRSRVEHLAKALEEQGWTVWWDPIIPTGKDFDDVIEDEISKARCVVVIWTKRSVKSKYVKGEAREALNRGILVPIEIESGVKPPFDFRSIQTLSLIDWDGSNNFPGFQKLIADIISILGEPPVEEQKRQREEAEKKAEKERGRNKEEDRKLREEELKQNETESKRKAEEEKSLKKQEELKRISTEPRKPSKILRFGVVAGALVLLITGGWLYYNYQQKNKISIKLGQVQIQKQETFSKIDEFHKQVEELERTVAKVDNQVQLKELTSQKDNLSHQVEGVSEQATRVGLRSQLETLQNHLERIQIELTNKEKELISSKNGRIVVESIPGNAPVKILNIDRGFRQGMELKPGKYHVEVSLEGHEPQDRWVELGAGEEKRIKFDLKKISPKVGKVFVETEPVDALVKILNIKPKFFQGMELEPGNYHVEVASEGYETQRRWIDIKAGDQEQFKFNLAKIEVAKPITALPVKQEQLVATKQSVTSPQKTFKNSIGMEFVLIPSGSFKMGSGLSPEEVVLRYGGEARWFKDEHPRHPVKITEPFYLQRTEVTQRQWKKVMGDNPSEFKDCIDDCPVETVSWENTQEFIKKLNDMEGTVTYRLPTEAEWE